MTKTKTKIEKLTVKVIKKDLELLNYFIKRVKKNEERTALYVAFVKDLEQKLNKKIKRNTCSLGLDIAERTGCCYITTTNDYATFDWWCLEFNDALFLFSLW